MRVSLERSGRTTGGSSYMTQIVREFNGGATSIDILVGLGEKQHKVYEIIVATVNSLSTLSGKELPVWVKKEKLQ